MPNLVLTVVGDDRAGLVKALAEVVSAHGGNWERSQLAELAGTFAGVVEVSVDSGKAEGLVEALRSLTGLLHVTVHTGGAPTAPPERQLTLNVLGNDRAGIVREVAAILERHRVSIDTMTTGTFDAPMSGGRLFEATVVARVPSGADIAAIGHDLELLANEIQVDINLDDD